MLWIDEERGMDELINFDPADNVIFDDDDDLQGDDSSDENDAPPRAAQSDLLGVYVPKPFDHTASNT